MRRAIMFGLSVLLALGMLALGALPAQAKATKTSYTGVETVVSVGMPEKEWVSDGILHVRGLILGTDFDVTIDGGTFSFSVEVAFGFNLDLATGDGNGFGTVRLDGTLGGLPGTFEGRFVAKFTGGVLSVQYVGHGSGGFEGMKIMGAGTEDPAAGVTMHAGIILDPHG